MLTKRMVEEIQEMSYSQKLPIINEIIEDENIKISNRLTGLEIELFNEKLFALVLNKKYIETVELANQLIKCLHDYNVSKVYKYKAEALHELEQYDECLNTYEKGFKSNPDLHCSGYSHYFHAADAAGQKGFYSRAFNYYKEGFVKFLEDAYSGYRRNFNRDNSVIEFMNNEFNTAWKGFIGAITMYWQSIENEEKLNLIRVKIKAFDRWFRDEAEKLVDYEFFDTRSLLSKRNELNRIMSSEPEFIKTKREEEAKKAEEGRLNNYLEELDKKIKSLDEDIKILESNESANDKETDSYDLWMATAKSMGFTTGNK